MPVWSGKYQYLDADGVARNEGACQFQFDAETAVVTPSGATPIAFDLGDVDRVVPGDWDLQLALYTGRTILLRQFGAAFSDMAREFVAAWRDRTIQCLLLEDLEEIARYDAAANAEAAELRIFRSNLAVLPRAGTPTQWRLAEVDGIRFDEAAYQILLESNGRRLVLGKLAQKTDEARQHLTEALDALHTESAQALHGIFPFLDPEALRRLQAAMPEGRSAPLTDLASIHARLPEALIAKAVDDPLRPYFDALRGRAQGPLFAGFKFIRPDQGEEEADDGRPAAFFWFFFPLPGNLLAWEATTGTGRATYFFRHSGDVPATVRQLTRGLALINFRREPVYLPDHSLEEQSKYRRYAIGARKLPELKALRAAYAGRAIHSSLEDWAAALPAM